VAPGGKVWYDDQRDVHRQIFEGDETIDYASMGQDPDAADNRWLREAFEDRIPIITAYNGRCALSRLPEPILLDAAHIVSDRHERLGQPEATTKPPELFRSF
jgi:hypothetical protein